MSTNRVTSTVLGTGVTSVNMIDKNSYSYFKPSFTG